MRTVKIEGELKVLTPLHHGGDEKSGVERLLRRMKYIVDGHIVEIPFVDGNAVRGYLRRLVMQDFLTHVDYELTNETLYYMFFSGGVLEEVTTQEHGVLNIELRKSIRSTLIPLSLFGTSFLNQAFTGKLIVGKCLPICKELNEYLPIKSETSIYNYLDFTFNTRRDELKQRSEEEQAVQMLYNYEVFTPGTRFYHWFTLLDTTPLEESCFSRMLTLWKARPFLGGRSAVGNGELEIHYNIPERFKNDEPYMNFLHEHKEDIHSLLRTLEKLTKSRRKIK